MEGVWRLCLVAKGSVERRNTLVAVMTNINRHGQLVQACHGLHTGPRTLHVCSRRHKQCNDGKAAKPSQDNPKGHERARTSLLYGRQWLRPECRFGRQGGTNG